LLADPLSPYPLGDPRRLVRNAREREVSVAAAEALLEECIHRPEGLPDAMDTAGRLLGFDYFCLVSSNLDNPAYIVSERQSEGIAPYFSDRWVDIDYRARAERPLPINTLFLDHRAVPDEERRRSAIYNELFVPRRMANYAGMRFDLDGSEEWFCFVMRSEQAGVIDGDDAKTFVRIARTAMNTASLATRLQTTRVSGMLEGLEASATAAVILDRNGRVRAVTPAAERIFGADLGVREGELWGANRDDAWVLSALVQAARNPDAPLARRRFLLRGQGRRRPVLVNISRVLGPALDALPGGRLLLVLSDLGAGDSAVVAELQSLFGLTAAEAQVAAAIFDGAEAADIARTRNVAETTVRKQISNIFRKLDVHRQVDLVRLLAGLRR
jgi:DNA-binding CsgD family transcriptional regulator/PAS domain-containing protein